MLRLALSFLILVIAIFLITTLVKNRPLVQKVNNIIMEGEVKENNFKPKFTIALMIVVIIILTILLGLQTGRIDINNTQTQIVNVNAEKSEKLSEELININEADKKELMLLEGVGETKAENILEYRDKHKFKRTTELINIVGETTYNNIKNKITLGGSK